MWFETILCSEKVSASDNRVLFCRWCGQTYTLCGQTKYFVWYSQSSVVTQSRAELCGQKEPQSSVVRVEQRRTRRVFREKLPREKHSIPDKWVLVLKVFLKMSSKYSPKYFLTSILGVFSVNPLIFN